MPSLGEIIGLIIAVAIMPVWLGDKRTTHETHYGNPTNPIVIKVRHKDLQGRHALMFRHSDSVKLLNYHYRMPDVMTRRELNRR